MERESYPKVDIAHIVPRMYQKAWVVTGEVAVHSVGSDRCGLMGTKRAGTRDAFYRRVRVNGDVIDDVEATLGVVEGKAAPFLRSLVGGAQIVLEMKGALAQFFGVQLMRGPAFFEIREEVLLPMIDQLEEEYVRPDALNAAGGDLDAVRKVVRDAYLDPTTRLVTMLQRAGKIAGVLGNMRWHILQSKKPLLAYSDHPVVVWPGGDSVASPPDRQRLGPLSALEVRVPVSPTRAILMNWIDASDPDEEVPLGPRAAAELNAFTIAQADDEWMHMPGGEPPVAHGTFWPLSRMISDGYSQEMMARSIRRSHATSWLERNKNRQWINDLELLDLSTMS